LDYVLQYVFKYVLDYVLKYALKYVLDVAFSSIFFGGDLADAGSGLPARIAAYLQRNCVKKLAAGGDPRANYALVRIGQRLLPDEEAAS
jgi:hypothetical protein